MKNLKIIIIGFILFTGLIFTSVYAYNYDPVEEQHKKDLKQTQEDIKNAKKDLATTTWAILLKEDELDLLYWDKDFYEWIIDSKETTKNLFIDKLWLTQEEFKEEEETISFLNPHNTLIVCGHWKNENTWDWDWGAFYWTNSERWMSVGVSWDLHYKWYETYLCIESKSIEEKAVFINLLKPEYVIELHFDVRPEGEGVTRWTKLIYDWEKEWSAEFAEKLCKEIWTCKTWDKWNMKFNNLVEGKSIIAEIADPNQENVEKYIENFINAF